MQAEQKSLADGEAHYRDLENRFETLVTVKGVSGLSKGQKYYVQFRSFAKKLKIKTAAKTASDAWNERELLKGYVWQVYVFEKHTLSDKKLGTPFFIADDRFEEQGYPTKDKLATVEADNKHGIKLTLELTPNWDLADIYCYRDWVTHTFAFPGGKVSFGLPPHMASRDEGVFVGTTREPGPRSDDFGFTIKHLNQADGGKESFLRQLAEVTNRQGTTKLTEGESTIAGNPSCWVSLVYPAAKSLTCETAHVFGVEGTLMMLSYSTTDPIISFTPDCFNVRAAVNKHERKTKAVWNRVLSSITFSK